MAHAIDETRRIRGKRRSRVDTEVGELARRQHGVVARRQLRALGLGADAVDDRLRAGRLHRVHRGVYAVGHALLSRHGVWMAAVLIAEHAVLSHRSASALWRIRQSDRVEITVATALRARPRIAVHRIALPADEVTVHDGIPVTTPAQTLLDLAGVLTPHDLERAANEAEVRRLTSPTSLDALVARYPGRPGTPAIKRLLEARAIGGNVMKEELEHRFRALLDEQGIPRPRTNADVLLDDGTWIKPDCHWPDANLIVELDGAGPHHTRHAFESDRARDRKAVASGHRVVRITWRQLHDDAATLANELRALLRPAR